MTKKYQLLLHIGLPKTATTSLQYNVLLPLHKQGKINFLGAAICSKISLKFYPFLKYRDEIRSALSHTEVVNLRGKVEELLVENKLNVLSDESFSNTVFFNTDNILHNLKLILINCDVKLLTCLRSPVDLAFSFYTHLYASFYRYKHLDTFEMFAQHLLNNVGSKEYAMFSPENYLTLLGGGNYFSNIKIMLFEDLINDEDYYFTTLSNLLKIDKNDIKSKFLIKKQNTKVTTSTGIKIRPVAINRATRKSYQLTRKRVWWLRILKKFGVGVAVERKYPNAKLSAQLFEALQIKDIDKFAKQYNLDKNKLIDYHYYY